MNLLIFTSVTPWSDNIAVQFLRLEVRYFPSTVLIYFYKMFHMDLGKKLYFLFICHVVCYAAIKLINLINVITYIFHNFNFLHNSSEMSEIDVLKSYMDYVFVNFFLYF